MTPSNIEKLEDRRLLTVGTSIDPVSVIMGPAVGSYMLDAAASSTQAERSSPAKVAGRAAKAKPQAEPIVRSINMVGEWDGDVKVRYGFFSRKYDLDLSIYEQGEGYIRAEIEIDGREYDGTFFGRINPKNGRFRYELDDHHEEIEISGQLSKRSRVIGGGKVKVEDGWWEVKGSFEVDRIA